MAEDTHDTPDAALDSGAPSAEGVDPLLDDGGGKKKKLFIIIGAVVLLLVGGGAGAYFMGLLDGLLGKEAKTEQTAEGGHGADAPALDEHGNPLPSVFLPIPDMIVNLSGSDATPRYLRLRVQLELKSDADKVKVEAVMPRVIDQFQTYLRELRVRDLRGSAGIYRLQTELLARVNEAAHPVVVQDVLFQEILIQ